MREKKCRRNTNVEYSKCYSTDELQLREHLGELLELTFGKGTLDELLEWEATGHQRTFLKVKFEPNLEEDIRP